VIVYNFPFEAICLLGSLLVNIHDEAPYVLIWQSQGFLESMYLASESRFAKYAITLNVGEVYAILALSKFTEYSLQFGAI